VAFREVRVHEVREVLRHWLRTELGLRPIAERAGVDRKTARRYIDAAVELGVVRECGLEQLSDELIGAVINAVRPERSQGHGAAWDRLLPVEEEILGWVVKDGLQLTNIHGKLERCGVAVPYRTLHRFASASSSPRATASCGWVCVGGSRAPHRAPATRLGSAPRGDRAGAGPAQLAHRRPGRGPVRCGDRTATGR
jgi:hypothetical protein